MKIPPITDEKLDELLTRIRPVVHRGKGLWFIQEVDPRTIAFTWDPKPTTEATSLATLAEVRTLHTFGYHGLFKPSIAEVLAQVPDDLIDTATAFSVVGPTDADDLNREKEALNEGFHVAETTFYGPDTTAKTVWERLGEDL